MRILLGPGLIDPKGNEAFLVKALKKAADVRTFDYREVPKPKDGWSPDVVVVRDAEYYLLPPGIEDIPVPIIGLVGDYNLTLPRMLPIMGVFDYFVCDLRGVLLFEKLGHRNVSYFCLYGYDPELHRDYGQKKQIDVVFVGNLNFSVQQDRARYIHELAKLRDKFKIVIASDVYGEDYARLLNTARVVFNQPVRGELNMRFFEAYGCGAVVLQPWSHEAEYCDFEHGKDYVVWLRDCYSDAELRSVENAMAFTGAEQSPGTFEEYTYDVRAQRLIDLISDVADDLDPRQRPFRMLPEPERKKRWAMYRAQAFSAYPWDNIPLFDGRLVRYQKALIDNNLDIPNFDFNHWGWWIDLLCACGYNDAAAQFVAEKEDTLRVFTGFGAIKEKLRQRLNREVYGFSV